MSTLKEYLEKQDERIDPNNDCSYCSGTRAEPKAPAPDCPGCRGTGEWPHVAKAVVASDGNGHGAVIEHNGGMLHMDIHDNGLTDLGDLGLDNAPAGLSVFEGHYEGGGYNGYSGDYDDVSLEGDFRDLTRAEWDAIIEKKRIF